MNFSASLGFEILTDDKKLANCKSLKKNGISNVCKL